MLKFKKKASKLNILYALILYLFHSNFWFYIKEIYATISLKNEKFGASLKKCSLFFIKNNILKTLKKGNVSIYS